MNLSHLINFFQIISILSFLDFQRSLGLELYLPSLCSSALLLLYKLGVAQGCGYHLDGLVFVLLGSKGRKELQLKLF